MPISSSQQERAFKALDGFAIELPSWGFANTGTRFGKFIQPSAATTTREKIADAGQVHRYTGCCPTVAVHVLWDFANGLDDVEDVLAAAVEYGVAIGAINPNLFQDQIYKHGSLANPDPEVREAAMLHMFESIDIQRATKSRDLSLWLADGTCFPGTGSIRARKGWVEECLKRTSAAMDESMRLLVEYKPFEPAFYHTDIADWGMALLLAKAAGSKGKVLVDTGHHYQAQNIEQIVAWLLDEQMLGGFHFNDRRYADDDLTLGSIDPYQVFRIFHEICHYEWERGARADIAYMVDQSHNLKNKIEEMIQTAQTAQELYLKAALVDHERLAHAQAAVAQGDGALIDAEECLRAAFFTDVRGVMREWREQKGLAEDPLQAFRESGYSVSAATERAERNSGAVSGYA